jgi:hypothetical protein
MYPGQTEAGAQNKNAAMRWSSRSASLFRVDHVFVEGVLNPQPL